MMLDVGHDFVGEGDPFTTIDQLAQRIVGMNFHDNDGSAWTRTRYQVTAASISAMPSEL